jgi:rod shape-determining protein MreD
MKPTIWRRLDTFARHLVPCVSIFALMLVGVVPLHIPALHPVAPALPLIAVFYWTLYRPDLLPAVTVFAAGLLQDILFDLPLGVSAFMLVLVHAAVSTQHRFFLGKSFGIVWLGFALVATAALALGWLVVCAYNGALIRPNAILFQVLTTIGFYPILSWLLLRCQAALLRQV